MIDMVSRFSAQNADLAELFRGLKGQEVLYVPNHGNAGGRCWINQLASAIPLSPGTLILRPRSSGCRVP